MRKSTTFTKALKKSEIYFNRRCEKKCIKKTENSHGIAKKNKLEQWENKFFWIVRKKEH